MSCRPEADANLRPRRQAPVHRAAPHSAAGYSILELLVVLAAAMVFGSIGLLQLRDALTTAQTNSAYYTTLSMMRQARQTALANRRVYVLTFVAPSTIRMERIEQDASRTQIQSVTLAANVQFRIEPGIPVGSGQTPDHLGNGSLAIDLNGSNQVYFQPDGSGRDASRRLENGVIYLARPGQLMTARAITLFGATGRIKGWRLSALAWHWM